MSLSTCEHCGGHIPLGPDASNRCETCGRHVFSAPEIQPGDRVQVDYYLYAKLVNERDRLKDAIESIRQYGSDTLSGPVGEPDDRAWQRAGVLEMTRRASLALNPNPGILESQR